MPKYLQSIRRFGCSRVPASTSSRKQDYTYDNLNRLTDIDTTTDAPVNTHYKYKLSDRNAPNQSQYRTTLVSTEFIGLRAYSYTFDVLGNITKITEGTRANQQETTGSGYVTKVTYKYDSLNRFTRENNVYTNTTTVYTYCPRADQNTKSYESMLWDPLQARAQCITSCDDRVMLYL